MALDLIVSQANIGAKEIIRVWLVPCTQKGMCSLQGCHTVVKIYLSKNVHFFCLGTFLMKRVNYNISHGDEQYTQNVSNPMVQHETKTVLKIYVLYTYTL